MITDNQVTWVILAGGQASRMGGQDKGLIHYQGKPLIKHVLNALAPQTSGIRICANRNTETYRTYAPVIEDIITGYAGPLAGLHAALSHSQTEWTGIIPCDGPYLHPELIGRFYQATETPAKAYVATDGHKIQPVYAMVHHSLLPVLEQYLKQGNRKVACFYQQTETAEVDCSDIPDMFININTPAQLKQQENDNS